MLLCYDKGCSRACACQVLISYGGIASGLAMAAVREGGRCICVSIGKREGGERGEGKCETEI